MIYLKNLFNAMDISEVCDFRLMCSQCRNFQSFLHARGLSTDIHLTFVNLLVYFSSLRKKKKKITQLQINLLMKLIHYQSNVSHNITISLVSIQL